MQSITDKKRRMKIEIENSQMYFKQLKDLAINYYSEGDKERIINKTRYHLVDLKKIISENNKNNNPDIKGYVAGFKRWIAILEELIRLVEIHEIKNNDINKITNSAYIGMSHEDRRIFFSKKAADLRILMEKYNNCYTEDDFDFLDTALKNQIKSKKLERDSKKIDLLRKFDIIIRRLQATEQKLESNSRIRQQREAYLNRLRYNWSHGLMDNNEYHEALRNNSNNNSNNNNNNNSN